MPPKRSSLKRGAPKSKPTTRQASKRVKFTVPEAEVFEIPEPSENTQQLTKVIEEQSDVAEQPVDTEEESTETDATEILSIEVSKDENTESATSTTLEDLQGDTDDELEEPKTAMFFLKVFGNWSKDIWDEDSNPGKEHFRQRLGSMLVRLPIEDVQITGAEDNVTTLRKTITFAVKMGFQVKSLNVPVELESFELVSGKGFLMVNWDHGERMGIDKTPVREENWLDILNFMVTRNAGDVLEADVNLEWKNEYKAPELW